MPKRTSTIPLADAFFASGEAASRLWSHIESVLGDFGRINSLEAPTYPQAPDESDVRMLRHYEKKLSTEPADASNQSIVSFYRERIVDGQTKRESILRNAWLRPFYEEFATRHDGWSTQLFEEGRVNNEVEKIHQLSMDAASRPFLLWRRTPPTWSWNWPTYSWDLETYKKPCPISPDPRDLPIFDLNGELVKPLLDALHRVAPMPGERILLGPNYLFDSHLWTLSGSETHYSEEEIGLLILEAYDAERRRIEKLRRKFSGEPQLEYKREPIPESVRTYVWRRDGGRCLRCGSQERLEFDHVIPVSLGGSNTERNIQLLCEPCNRQKSNSI